MNTDKETILFRWIHKVPSRPSITYTFQEGKCLQNWSDFNSNMRQKCTNCEDFVICVFYDYKHAVISSEYVRTVVLI